MTKKIYIGNNVVKWIGFGDANTHYFHTIANDKHRTNKISMLLIDGQECQDPKQHLIFY